MKKGIKEIVEIINKIWPGILHKHFYPSLPKPVVAEEWGGKKMDLAAYIDMIDKQLVINPKFCDYIAKKMPLEDALSALLDHEIVEYRLGLEKYLILYSNVKDIIQDVAKAKKATDLFIDTVVNTFCVKEYKEDTKIPDLFKNTDKDVAREIVGAACQLVWKRDLGIKFKDEYLEVVGQLAHLPYLREEEWESNAKEFAVLIEPYLIDLPSPPARKGRAKNPFGAHGIKGYTDEEKENVLKRLEKKLGKSKTKEIAADFGELQKIWEKMRKAEQRASGGVGRGTGHSIGVDLEFYEQLAKRYKVSIPLVKTGALYPTSIMDWDVDKSIDRIDMFASFGEVMPGISQMYKREEGEPEKQLRDLLNIIDSSSSTPKPGNKFKTASLLYTYAISMKNAYIDAGSYVAALNHSDALAGGQIVVNLTRDGGALRKAFQIYLTGGTTLDIKTVDRFARDGLDISWATDLQIDNFNEVAEYFKKINNRVRIAHLGTEESVYNARKFAKFIGNKPNITIHRLDKLADIRKIK
jgi:hypothetical protein